MVRSMDNESAWSRGLVHSMDSDHSTRARTGEGGSEHHSLPMQLLLTSGGKEQRAADRNRLRVEAACRCTKPSVDLCHG